MANIGALVPLIILVLLVGVCAFVGYSMYLWSSELTERGKNKMAKKNLSFTKEGGLRVGVKEMQNEQYADKTQNVLVNVWNNASLPNYKSRLGWNSTQATGTSQKRSSSSNSKSSGGTASPRPSGSRTNTSSSSSGAAPSAPKVAAAAANLPPPAVKRTPSTPGAW